MFNNQLHLLQHWYWMLFPYCRYLVGVGLTDIYNTSAKKLGESNIIGLLKHQKDETRWHAHRGIMIIFILVYIYIVATSI